MARLFTRAEALALGTTYETIRWGIARSQYRRLERGVYFAGDREPNSFERRLAVAMRGVAPVGGELAASLHGFDGFDVPSDGRYANISRTGVHETLLAIAATTTDTRWELALEWCLRSKHTTIDEIEQSLKTQRRGNGRIRRVLKLRPPGAPATGSALETIAVQLIRRNPELPTPSRQVKVSHWYLDLAWPEHGVFLELDGEWHKGQPRYDAVRQTGVVAATGWLVGRYTWTAVVRHPNSTLRSLAALFHARELSKNS